MLRAGSGEQTSYFEVLRDTQQREVVYPGVMLRAWKEGLTGGRYKQGRKYHHNRKSVGDSLADQWLGFLAFTAADPGSLDPWSGS